MTGKAFDVLGAEHRPHFVSEAALLLLEAQFATLPVAPGHRLAAQPRLQAWLSEQGITELAASLLGRDPRPVRAVLFDKTPDVNWSLGWHQDRTIA